MFCGGGGGSGNGELRVGGDAYSDADQKLIEYFLWHLHLILVEANKSNVSGPLFEMMMQTDLLRFLLLLDSGRQEKMIVAKMEIKVGVKKIAEVVAKVAFF